MTFVLLMMIELLLLVNKIVQSITYSGSEHLTFYRNLLLKIEFYLNKR